jgi:hypothetical protein
MSTQVSETLTNLKNFYSALTLEWNGVVSVRARHWEKQKRHNHFHLLCKWYLVDVRYDPSTARMVIRKINLRDTEQLKASTYFETGTQ